MLLRGAVTALASMLLLAPFALAADGIAEIDSAGPLTRVIVSNDLNCQVAHQDDLSLELYDGDIGACGTFLAFGGTLYAPGDVPQAGLGATPWTPVSQSAVAGSGSASDPYRVVTVVNAGSTGLQLTQTDTYVVGTQMYRTDITIANGGSAAVSGTLYRAGDCYLQEHDIGYGRVDRGAPACVVDQSSSSRIEQWLPATAGSNYFEGVYSAMWALIDAQQPFPDTCDCDVLEDNAAGLSWQLSLPAGGVATVSHDTFFSPIGGSPAATQSLASSVPDPLQVTLDPVVVAQSVAITAVVILLVPFPSAIFNSTLEDNYDEVMAMLARLRRRLSAAWARFVAWLRARWANRQASRQVQPTSSVPPPIIAPAAVPPPPGQHEPVFEPGPEPIPTVAPGADVWRTPLGVVGFILLSALLYSFLDPTFGLSLGSLAELLGLAAGLLIILLAYGIPLILFSRRHSIGLTVRALPATLGIAMVCVLLSRLVDFQPGYLYGLIVGFYFAHEVTHETEGKAEAAAAGVSLAAALVAWITLALLRGGLGPTDVFMGTLLEAATVTVVVAGIENAMFAMLPLRFLPGAAVYEWDRRVWLLLIALGVFAFAHVLLNPAAGAGYLGDTTRTSFVTMVVLLVAFGVASAAFWAYFRFRPGHGAAAGPEGPEAGPGL